MESNSVSFGQARMLGQGCWNHAFRAGEGYVFFSPFGTMGMV